MLRVDAGQHSIKGASQQMDPKLIQIAGAPTSPAERRWRDQENLRDDGYATGIGVKRQVGLGKASTVEKGFYCGHDGTAEM